jgi:hypothetical protein
MPREKLLGTDFSNYLTEPNKVREGYRRAFENGFVTDLPLTIGQMVGVFSMLFKTHRCMARRQR